MIAIYEPDWDAGTENAYEAHLERRSSDGLCIRPWCYDEALPNDELCANCLAELEPEDEQC